MGRSGRNSPTSSKLQTPKQTSLSKFFGPRKQSEIAEGAQDGIEQQKPAKRGRGASPTPAAEQDPAADDGPAPALSLGVVAPERDDASKRPIGRPRGSKTKPKGQAAADNEQEEPVPSGRPRGRPKGKAHSEIRIARGTEYLSSISSQQQRQKHQRCHHRKTVTSVDGTRRPSVGVAAESAGSTDIGAPRRRGRPPKNGSVSAGPAPAASAAPETSYKHHQRLHRAVAVVHPRMQQHRPSPQSMNCSTPMLPRQERSRSRRSVAQINYAEQIDPSISVLQHEEKEDLDELEDLGEPDESDALRHIKQVTEWDGPKPKDHGPNPTRIDRSPPKSHLPPFLNDPDDTSASENSALDIRMLNANAQALENGMAEPLACDTRGWAINAGISVWSIDWVPVAEGVKPKHDFVTENMKYLNSSKEVMPAPGSIQIWRLDTEGSECLLDMALVHNFGRCISLKWCPISMPEDSGGEGLAVRGYLAAIFGDGYLRVCGIPASEALRAAAGVGEGEPRSVLETRWVHGIFTSMDWVGSSVVMAGTSSGHLTLWSLAESISVQRRVLGHQWPGHQMKLFPMIAAKLHQSAVLSAVPMFDDITCPQQESGFRQIGPRNVQVLTVGNDGRMKQICLAFPLRYTNPLACHPGHPRCLIWLHETASLVMSDPDNILRVISPDISPNGNDPWMLSCLHQPPRDQPPGRALGGRRGDQPVHWNDNYDCSTFLCMKVDGKVLMAQASEFHTYYGAVAEGGDLMVQNYGWLLPAKKIPPLYRRIYRLLWEYDDIDVEMDGDVTGDKETPGISGRPVCVGRQPVQARAHKPGGGTKQVNIFPPQIAVQVCAWSRNRSSSSWIASGGAGGLVRIEDVSP
ncbi:hypothetical protein DL89DRAFT_268610 [Linderina pennispora]|uniref:WD40 repeat-like protein n=1 Tax=Linderina pennispora TaxID=61395 RepID=A0A1Y1W602_9FUNG|nr:uncharacterized protein DL89DRAFT_268610 [Linderina pennispora]ORX68842.1 hypothetical protein DL89DRAFT_268610 [Linderina pennispora]